MTNNPRHYYKAIQTSKMSSLEDIPYELFIDYLLPLFGLGEVGALTMTCRIWRDMCNCDEVWKTLYLRTIRAKITDGSIHLGPTWNRRRDYRGETALRDKLGICPSLWTSSPQYVQLTYKSDPTMCTVLPNPGVTITKEPPFGSSCQRYWWRESSELLRTHPCLRCPENMDFAKTLKTWREVRDDGVDSDDFALLTCSNGWHSGHDCAPYLSYVENAWKDYNRARGLSGVNLCQCANHYDFTSLGFPDKCTNFKDFKKMTLKKEKTKASKLAKKTSTVLKTRERQYEAAKRAFETAMALRNEAICENERLTKLCENLDNYPGVKKVKKVKKVKLPPVIVIAHTPESDNE